MSRLQRILVAVLLVAGATLRFAALDRIPLPIQQDELSNVYDGLSIAQTGADRSGIAHPLVVRGFGEADYRPPLYAWLAALPQSITGFSVAAGRLPSAVLGVAALVLLFAFAARVGGVDFGIVTLALAAFSPWLISFSRVAHEGAMLPPFFLALILFLWERAYATDLKPARLFFLGFAVGLSTNSYQSTRLTAFLFAIAIMIFIAGWSRTRIRNIATFGAAALLGALPQIIVLIRDPIHFAARSRDTLAKSASVIGFVGEVIHNFGLNLAPVYLFVPNMAETYMTSARLLPIELLLFYPGILAIRKISGETAAKFRPYLYAALFIGVLPAAINNQNPHSLRSSDLAILTPIFSAATVIFLRDAIGRRRSNTKLFDIGTAASIVGSFALVAAIYFYVPQARAARMQHDIALAATAANARQQSFERVFFDSRGYQPYLYVVAFSGMTPSQFMSAEKRMGSAAGKMDIVSQVGKYFFLDSLAMEQQAGASMAAGSRDLFVTRQRTPGLTILDSVLSTQRTYYVMQAGR